MNGQTAEWIMEAPYGVQVVGLPSDKKPSSLAPGIHGGEGGNTITSYGLPQFTPLTFTDCATTSDPPPPNPDPEVTNTVALYTDWNQDNQYLTNSVVTQPRLFIGIDVEITYDPHP
jgi:hypothetical protein